MSEKTEMMLFGSLIFICGFSLAIIIAYVNGQNVIDKFTAKEPELNSNGNITQIVFNSNVSNMMDYLWKNSVNEVSFCLKGHIDNGVAYITNLSESKMITRSGSEVINYNCKDSIGDMHTHPSAACIFSDIDMFTFGELSQKTDRILFGVICGEGEYKIYSSDNVGHEIGYVIG